MFCCALLCVHSNFAIILMEKRELIALPCVSSRCFVIVVWLFRTIPRVCLQFVIVVFPDHTHLLFRNQTLYDYICYLWRSLVVIRYFAIMLMGGERARCFALFVFLVSCDWCAVLPHVATGLSAVCDCDIFWSYSIKYYFKCTYEAICCNHLKQVKVISMLGLRGRGRTGCSDPFSGKSQVAISFFWNSATDPLGKQ